MDAKLTQTTRDLLEMLLPSQLTDMAKGNGPSGREFSPPRESQSQTAQRHS